MRRPKPDKGADAPTRKGMRGYDRRFRGGRRAGRGFESLQVQYSPCPPFCVDTYYAPMQFRRMAKTSTNCEYCGSHVLKENKELNRIRARGARVFCNNVCSGAYAADSTRKKRFMLTCACGAVFESSERARGLQYCSKRCANVYNITERKRENGRAIGAKYGPTVGADTLALLHTTEQAALGLRARELPRYAEVQARLNAAGVRHEVEVSIGNFVYDLVLLDARVVVEFDGPYHAVTRVADTEKDSNAAAFGYTLKRVPHERGVHIFPAAMLDGIVG